MLTLGYASWKIILEHMDANRRLNLSYKCPKIRSICKLTPLKIGHISLGSCGSITMNKATYEFWMILRMFADRKRILVQNMDVYGDINTSPDGKINYPLPMMPGSLHLKYMAIQKNVGNVLQVIENSLGQNAIEKLELNESTDFTHPIIQSADALILTGFREARCLLRTENSRVHGNFNQDFDRDEARNLIEDWKNKKYDIGRYYTVEVPGHTKIKAILEDLKTINGAEIKEIEEIKHTDFPEYITFPMTWTAELNVYCLSNFSPNDPMAVYPVHKGFVFIVHFVINSRGYAKKLEPVKTEDLDTELSEEEMELFDEESD